MNREWVTLSLIGELKTYPLSERMTHETRLLHNVYKLGQNVSP